MANAPEKAELYGRQVFVVLEKDDAEYKYLKGNVYGVSLNDKITIEYAPNVHEKTLFKLMFGHTELGNFYCQNHGKFGDPATSRFFFVNLRHESVYELETWCCTKVDFVPGSKTVMAVIEMRDSERPLVNGACSERMHRMHSVLTRGMTEEMIRNLSTATQQEGLKRRAFDAGDGVPVVNTVFRRPPLTLQPLSSKSPFDLRVAHIRHSIHNAGPDVMREFDERVHHWETGAAENDLVNWQAQMKGMVMAVVAALVCTCADERKLTNLELRETLLARQLQPHHRRYSKKQFEQEAAMAALWDCGNANMYHDIEDAVAVDTATRDGILGLLQNVITDADEDDACLDASTKEQLKKVIDDKNVKSLFTKRARQSQFALTRATEARRLRAINELGNGAPKFKRESEHRFASEVYAQFAETVQAENSMTLIGYDRELPSEGLGYTTPIVNFGVCGFDSDNKPSVSIGHGVGLMVEATEIAVLFMQHSEWGKRQRARAQTVFSTVDKPFKPDGIDVDSPAGTFPEGVEELLENPVALETYVGPLDMHGVDNPVAQATSSPYAFLTMPNSNQKKFIDDKWWKRPPPWEETMAPIPGVAGAQFLSSGDNTQTAERQISFINCFVQPSDVAEFLISSFMGAVVERANPLEAPLYAKLVNLQKQADLRKFASENGFVDLTQNTSTPVIMLYHTMRQQISESTQVGRRMNHLLQPLLVKVHGQSRSIMQLKGFWGPKSDFFAVEAECCFIFREVIAALYRVVRPAGRAINEGTLGEVAHRKGFHHFVELLQMVNNNDRRQIAAGLIVRLVESVQSSNESIRDTGKTYRQKEARHYVDQSRQAYANLLARVPVN